MQVYPENERLDPQKATVELVYYAKRVQKLATACGWLVPEAASEIIRRNEDGSLLRMLQRQHDVRPLTAEFVEAIETRMAQALFDHLSTDE